jgi:aryl-alcohol dehydrogenase-like predicted oxidoreductase
VVEENINRSLKRMAVPTLDLLQFHWWEYRDPNYLDALKHLAELQRQGKIRHLALTNFDTEHLKLILDNGIKIVSNQVQYSLVDRRPQVQMTELCQQAGVQLLTYGTLCGGFLSATYLGRSEPRGGQLETVSLRKYKQMIDAWGGWGLLQELLVVLQEISIRRGASISNIAVRYILDQPAVAGVIVGARLGISQHLEDNARVFSFTFDQADRDQIEAVVGRSRNLFQLIGDCGDEYRR